MPNEQDNKNTIPNKATMHQLPIDLAPNKVIVKPANDNSKMSIQPTFRTIQQPPQMRVVRMPSGSTGAQIIQTHVMPQAILKPAIPGRSTITVSKSPATYLPRVTATLSTIQGANRAGTGQQQLRTPTPPSSIAGISPALLRTAIQPRTSSPNTVLSQGTTAWVSGGGAMQVQVPQIIRSTITQNRTLTANLFGPTGGQQNSTISVSTSSSGTSGQPTYVATVLPQRPQGATIVYTSQQQQPLFQGQVQRMGIATASANARQIRPIRQISTTGIRVNSSTLSIRQNVPGLTPTTILSAQSRNNTGLPSSTAISSPIPARIFQVQSQQAPSGSQVIGQSNQKILQANVMLPIIVNNSRSHLVQKPVPQGIIAHVSKLTSGTNDGTIISNSMTNTMPTISNTMVASIQSNQSIQSQVAQGTNHQPGTIYTTQSTQQVSNLSNQGGSQIIQVSQQQQQQLINNQQNIHHGGSMQTVVPLAIGSRNANIPIKTITVSASNSVSLDSAVTVHRNLSSNAGNLQATTIMPITKIVSQQQVVHSQHNISGTQVTAQPVYIQTRIPTASSVASTAHSQIISAPASNSTSTFSSSGTPTAVYYEQASLSSAGSNDNKPTSSTGSTHENSYTVATGANVQRYNEKMIHSIIASTFQNQSGQGNNVHIQQQQQSNQQSVPIRFSPLVVESQTGQQTSHQIITMGSSNIIQQQQQQGISSEATAQMIVPVSTQIPTSPRGANVRKQSDTPTKATKKQPKAKSYQMAEGLQLRVPQRQPLAAGIAQLTQTLKPIEQKQLHSTASSPKTTFSERESPSQALDEWSDGSTTVSIPNSPNRSEEDDLDAMILSNQFNKMSEEFVKFAGIGKSPGKLGSGVKRDAGDHHVGSPRQKKLKQ